MRSEDYGIERCLLLTIMGSLSYLPGQNITRFCDTSTFHFDHIHFQNVSGNGLATRTSYPGRNITFEIALLCSKEAPCTDLTFHDVNIDLPAGYTGPKVLCANAQVEGLNCNA